MLQLVGLKGPVNCTVVVVEIRITRPQLSTQGFWESEFQESEEILMRCEEGIFDREPSVDFV